MADEDLAIIKENFEKFYDRISELRTVVESDGKSLDYYLIPLEKDKKEPSVSASWTKHRKVIELTIDEARERLEYGYGNIGLVATNDYEVCTSDTIALCFIDIDVNEDGTFKLPTRKVYELLRHFDTFTVKTRSGGFHLYVAAPVSLSEHFKRTYGTKNPQPRYNGIKFGECRISNQYIACVGSYVPFDSEHEKKGYREDATGFYQVEIDKPIRIITEEDFPRWISFRRNGYNENNVMYEDVTVDIDKVKSTSFDGIVSNLGLTLDQARARDEVLNRILCSANETLESSDKKRFVDRSTTDFVAVKKLKKFGFTKEQVWVIIRECRPYAKTFRDDYMSLTISKVFGQIDLDENAREINDFDENLSITETEEIVIDKFPDELPMLPGEDWLRKCFHIKGLPRTGKSYNGVRWMGEMFNSGVYVCPNHEIINQQFENFKRMFPDKTCVRVMGKSKDKVCTYVNNEGRRYDCANCPKKPQFQKEVVLKRRFNSEQITKDEYDFLMARIPSHWEMEKVAKELVMRFKHIDLNLFDTPDYKELYETDGKSYCPYYLLHYCETVADYVFTVPYYTVSQDEITQIHHRDVCVIDEDTSFKFYFPADVTICEYANLPSGFSFVKNNLSDQMDTLDRLEEHTTTKIEKNDDGTIKRTAKSRLMKVDKIILGIIDYIREMHNAIEVFRTTHTPETYEELEHMIRKMECRPRGAGRDVTLDKPVYFIEDFLKLKVLEVVAQFEKDVATVAENSLSQFFEPFLYPYIHNRLMTIGNNPKSLYLVGDKEQLIRVPKCSDRYVLIGFTEAEMFAKMMFPEPTDRLRIRVNFFPYGKNFNVFVARGETKRSQSLTLNALMRSIVDENKSSEWKAPFMVLTSSQKKQEAVWQKFSSDATHMSRKDDIARHIFFWLGGMGVVFYQNSVISRGIDIPWMDMIFVDSCNFAQPYWMAVIDAMKRNIIKCIDDRSKLKKKINEIRNGKKYVMDEDEVYDDDEFSGDGWETVDDGDQEPGEPDDVVYMEELYEQLGTQRTEYEEILERAKVIKHNLLMDETTNSVLRPTPVNGKRDGQVKHIVMTETDFVYLSSDAAREMNIIDITGKADVKKMARMIRESVSLVNPNNVTRKALAKDIEKITSSPEIIGGVFDDDDYECIRFGKTYEEFSELVTTIEGTKTSSLTPLDVKDATPEVQLIARKMVKHVNFKKATRKDKNKSTNVSSESLIKWTKEQFVKSKQVYKLDDYDSAIDFLIRNRWVTPVDAQTKHKIGDITYDDSSVIYTLTMYQRNRDTIKRDTNGEVEVVVELGKHHPQQSSLI